MDDRHDQNQIHASHSMLQLFGLLLVLLAVVSIAVVLWESQTVATPQPNSTPTVADQKTVTDAATGFSFQIPVAIDDATFGLSGLPGSFYYEFFVEKVSTLPDEAPTFGDRKIAEDDQAALLNNQLGSTAYLHPLASSMKLVKIDNSTVNAKTFTSFGSGTDCTDRQPVRSLVTYRQGYRIVFRLYVRPDTLQELYPTYFANDPTCTPGDSTMVLLTKTNEFFVDVSAGKLSGIADDWYRTFNTIVSSMTFGKNTTSATTQPMSLTPASAAEREDLGYSEDSYSVDIYQKTAKLLHGRVSQQVDANGGPSSPFYAVLKDSHWKLVWSGQELSCTVVDENLIPANMYDECYESNLETRRQGTFDYRPYY